MRYGFNHGSGNDAGQLYLVSAEKNLLGFRFRKSVPPGNLAPVISPDASLIVVFTYTLFTFR